MGQHDASAEPLRGLHVLVIDDDATARAIIRGTLEDCGALVTESDAMAAALLSLQRILPDLIVCALNLGAERGAYDFLERMRADTRLGAARIPIVAIARDGARHPLNQALEAGFAGYIKAPFDRRQLCGVIADVSDAHPREPRRES